MKKTLFIITLIFLVTIVVGLVILNDKKVINEPVVDNSVATTSAVSNIPSPLTLASLKALPNWNPTMEVEGMKRVEDGVATLSDPNFKIQKDSLKLNTDYYTYNESIDILSRFTVIHADSSFDESVGNKNCKFYENKKLHKMIRDCVSTPVEFINELIIISDDTGEVLHKYKLKDGYSFAYDRSAMYDKNIVSLGRTYIREDLIFTIDIYSWNDWGDIKPNARYVYDLNLLTGELKLKFKTPA